MKNETTNAQLQQLGGWAAIMEALAYLIGFTVMIFFLSPKQGTDHLAFLLEHKRLYQWWLVVIYVLFGILLVPLVAAVFDRLRQTNDLRLRFGTLFGYVWVVLVIASGMVGHQGLEAVARIYPGDTRQAAVVWAALEGVQNGLGGGVEIVGGLWVLLLSLVAIRANELQKGTNYLGVAVGIAGMLTVVPGLGDLGAVFGLLQIGWFIAIGRNLLQMNNR